MCASVIDSQYPFICGKRLQSDNAIFRLAEKTGPDKILIIHNGHLFLINSYADITNDMFAGEWAFWFLMKTLKAGAVALKLQTWCIKLIYVLLMQLCGCFIKRDYVCKKCSQMPFDALLLNLSMLHSVIFSFRLLFKHIN